MLEGTGARRLEGSGYLAVEGTAIVYSDNFNRADTSAPQGLGAAWDAPEFFISGNATTRSGSTTDFARFQQDLGSPDHWVEARIIGWSANYVMVNARAGAAAVSNVNCYLGFLQPGGTTAEIGRNQGGGVGYATLSTTSNANGTADYTTRLEVQGTAIRFYVNGVLAHSTTDSLLTTGNFCGLNIGVSPASSVRIDSFRCGLLPYTP
jgi:hypothetical protein